MTICVAKTKTLISFAVTAKLSCTFVFAYSQCWFCHDAAYHSTIRMSVPYSYQKKFGHLHNHSVYPSVCRTDGYGTDRRLQEHALFRAKMFCTVFHQKLYASNVLLYRPCMSIYYLPKHHNFRHGSLVVLAEICYLATKTLWSGTVYRFVYVTGRNRRSLRKNRRISIRSGHRRPLILHEQHCDVKYNTLRQPSVL